MTTRIYANKDGTPALMTPTAVSSEGGSLSASGGTMTGALTLAGDPTAANEAATKNYVDNLIASKLAGYLPLSGGTMTGTIVINSSAYPAIAGNVTDRDYIDIGFPWATSAGGLVAFRAANYAGNPGGFEIYAKTSAGQTILKGKRNGELSWGGHVQASYFNATSDARKKENIERLPQGDWSGVHAYTYHFKKDEKKTPHVGLVAQEVQKVLPDAVSEDEEGFLTLDYNAVVAALVEKVNELSSRLEALEAS